MNLSGLRARIVVAASLVGALLFAAFAILIWSVVAYRDAVGDIRTSERSIGRADSLEKLILDLETGQRGYVITGDERFLQPWKSARGKLAQRADEFVRLEGEAEDEDAARRIGDLTADYLRLYSVPLVELARRDRQAAADVVAATEGKRRVDELRRLFADFVAGEQAEADARRARADRLGSLAVAVGIAGLVAAVLLVVLLYNYLSRAVIRPVGRLARATDRLAAGELEARVPDTGRRDEVGTLGTAFNAMAGSLEDNRDELESQNTELEAQQLELEHALGELAEQRDRVVALNHLSSRLTSEAEVEALAVALLEDLGDLGIAEVGMVYAAGVSRRQGLRLVAARGLHPDGLDGLVVPDEGHSGRALAARTPVEVPGVKDGEGLSEWGEAVGVRHELHLPLVQGDRVLGVVVLGKVGAAGFTPDDRQVLESMCDQAAIAFSNAIALRRARREASVTRAVLDATPDGICLTDAAGEVVLANAPMLDLSVNVLDLEFEGSVFDRLLGAADRMVDPDAYRDGMEEIAAHPDGEFRQEYTLAASNRSFLGYVAPVRDSTGTLGGRVFVLRETTPERQAERLKDELVATVSHELRTPLTSIIGYLELVLGETDDGVLGDQQRRFLEVVDRNARRLLDVVGDLLFVAQVEAGRLVLELEPIDLSVLAAEAVANALPLAEGKEIDVRVDAEPGLLATGDRIRLSQLVANLVSNAIKFTPDRGRVAISAQRAGGRAVLEVADTGIGVPEDEQDRLFQRFFRSRTASQHAIQGTGLGLVICKAIAEAHGGSISFSSRPGEGTTFRVEIPLAARAGVEVGVT